MNGGRATALTGKIQVAKDAANKFNPTVKLVAHHANIKDAQFNVEWFKGFTMVFNALDNLDARRHVNRICLAADIPRSRVALRDSMVRFKSLRKVRLRATTVLLRRPRRAIRSVRFGAHRVSRFIALSGGRAIC